MRCEEVNILLADYLGKKLPSGEMAAVKEHLRQCADCREELRFLKKYMKEIVAFPTVKPPDHFLDSIHERLNRPKRDGIMRKLFVPIRVKVPLEAAALIALALTGVIVFKPFRIQELEVKSEGPVIGAEEKSEKASSPENRAARRERSPMTAEGDDTTGEKKKEADLLEGTSVASSDSEGPADLAEITLYLKQHTAAISAAQPRDSVAERKSELADEAKADSQGYLAAKKDRAAGAHSKQTAPPEEHQAGVDGLAGLAQALDGRIIKKEYGAGAGSAQIVIVEIPAKNYARFMNGLRSGWSIQKQYPDAPSRSSRRVRINMNVQN
jgi:cytoskeletal protein RodZ